MLVGFGCQCKWIRGFGLAVLVVSWVWVVGASGFWLPVQVDLWLWVGGANSFVGLGCQC